MSQNGKHLNLKFVKYLQGTEFIIRPINDKTPIFNIDGEILHGQECRVKVLPGCIHFLGISNTT